jgi:lysine 2,3-aminomutase
VPNQNTWQIELRKSIRHPEELVALGAIAEDNLPQVQEIHKNFPFSVTPYYANLIRWDDPHDPLLRLVVPSLEELDRTGGLDVSGEKENTEDDGVQMMYPCTVLLLSFPACLAYCRFCFRKRLFNPEVKGEEILKNLETAIAFIQSHPRVDNVLLTGGDPLMLQTPVLRKFITALCKIDHVRIIRFGTRALVFLPSRITGDQELLDLLGEVSRYDRRIYMINHFNHPRELTKEVGQAADALTKAGVMLANQGVLLKGVNDSPVTLRLLLKGLAEWGITPYYLFQCRPVQGSHHFLIPLHETCDIFSAATRDLNGLAKRVKLIISHTSGKIEILGTGLISGQRHIYLKYHEARNTSLTGQISCYPLPDNAYWPDDLPGFS